MYKRNWKRLLAVLLLVMLFVSGCSLPALGGPAKQKVRIGTLGTAESKTMGYINQEMIKHYTDLKTTIITNLGSSVVQHKAMLDDEVDITSTRYPGTDLAILDIDPI